MPRKFFPIGPIDNKPLLVQLMARYRIGDESLSESRIAKFSDVFMLHAVSMNKYKYTMVRDQTALSM